MFEGYLFTRTKDAVAGITWWNNIPFGFYAQKNGSFAGGANFASGTITTAHFLGKYNMNHDGWKGKLSLWQSNGAVIGSYTDGNGAVHNVRTVLRTASNPLPNTWGPDHKIELYIDFADTANANDDQKFEAYLFTQTKDAMAGVTWWNNTPYGFYAEKDTTPVMLKAPQTKFSATLLNGVAPLVVTLDSSESSDEDGRIVNYKWLASDGQTSSDRAPKFTFKAPGNYTITLITTDNDGLTTQSDPVEVHVAVPQIQFAPVAKFSVTPQSGVAPLKVTLDGSASTDADGSIISYQWTASDGQTAIGKQASLTFSKAGDYKISLTVKDNDGLSSASNSASDAPKSIQVSTAFVDCTVKVSADYAMSIPVVKFETPGTPIILSANFEFLGFRADGKLFWKVSNYAETASQCNDPAVLSANLALHLPKAVYTDPKGEQVPLVADFQFMPSADGNLIWELTHLVIQ